MSCAQRHVHIALHKPRGFSCSHNPSEAPIIDELLPQELREIGLQAVGRLDRDTSGLLILTTDGGLIHRLAQPSSKIEKHYRVGYRGVLREDAVARCAAGIEIEGYESPTLPARLVVERPGRFQTADAKERLGEASLVLHEGRHHQVRRMFRAMRVKVVTLHRERLGCYVLPADLAPGEFTPLDVTELERSLNPSAQRSSTTSPVVPSRPHTRDCQRAHEAPETRNPAREGISALRGLGGKRNDFAQ